MRVTLDNAMDVPRRIVERIPDSDLCREVLGLLVFPADDHKYSAVIEVRKSAIGRTFSILSGDDILRIEAADWDIAIRQRNDARSRLQRKAPALHALARRPDSQEVFSRGMREVL